MKEALAFNKQGLEAYQYMQDNFLGMSGDGGVYVYHDIIQQNINVIDSVVNSLKNNKAGDALEEAYAINGGLEYNAYSFGLKTCEEGLKVAFCDYVTDNRLYGKAVGRAETYPATHALVNEKASDGFRDEIALYEKERAKLMTELKTYMTQEINGMGELAKKLAVK